MNHPNELSTPPTASSLRHLQVLTSLATLHTLGNMLGMAIGITLANADGWISYILSQLLLAFVFIHAFVLLHEAGHNTLFKQRFLNQMAGHYAGFIALIPFTSWKLIHARHHRYTGWQDLDATTATLVPRPLSTFETVMINFAWRTSLPLFSILYRLQNYWHIRRVHIFVQKKQHLLKLRLNALLLLFCYGLICVFFGFWVVCSVLLPALLLALAAQDILLLSQHSHIPQHNSEGQKVRGFKSIDQAVFSRSLRLPNVLSLLLMRFDAHELHHMYPHISGYQLHKIAFKPANEVNWWRWIVAAKRLKGDVFLFSNRDMTGSKV